MMRLIASRVGQRLIVFTLSALAPAGAAAQEFRGAVTGLVTDASGARLPGVTVTATNLATNVASTVVTNTEGNYAIAYLIPGRYTVHAELAGFKKAVREAIELRIGDRLGVDFSMELGTVEETVMVTAQSRSEERRV